MSKTQREIGASLARVLLSGAAAGLVLSSGCASTKAYLADRGRDAGDIVSVAVGTGVGAKVRVSAISFGLLHEGSMAGLTGGSLFAGAPGKYCNDVQFFCCGSQHVAPPGSEERYKKFDALQAETIGGQDGEWCLLPPFCLGPLVPLPQELKHDRAPYYYTHIEVVAGLVGSVRVGFNPGELVDFMLGIVGLDILHDDLARRERMEAVPGSAAKPPSEGVAPR